MARGAGGGDGNTNLPALAGSPPSSRLTFLQINLQHSKAAAAELSRRLTKLHTCTLAQEPYLVGGGIRGISSQLGRIFSAPDCVKPRACVIVNDPNVSVLALPHLTSRDVATVQLDFKLDGRMRSVLAASVYLPFDSDTLPPSHFMQLVVQYGERHKLPLVLGCDANAHHSLWGSSNINERGVALLQYISTTSLEILNKGNIPTFVTASRREVIDITLCTDSLADEIKNWHVINDCSFSDHKYICFSISVDRMPAALIRNKRATNWDVYRTELQSRLDPANGSLSSTAAIDEAVSKLSHAISLAFEKACPLRRFKHVQHVPWWSRELGTLRRSSRRLFRVAYASDATDDWLRYKQSRREYKRELLRSKRQSWQDFCGNIQGNHAAAKLFKHLGSKQGGGLGLLQLPNGEFTTNRESTLAHLLKVHFPGSQSLVSPPSDSASSNLGEARDWRVAEGLVSVKRVEWAIQSFAPFKAAGEDGIFPAQLQQAGDLIYPLLCKIYRACIALSYVPKLWRCIRVVFIPKIGKPTYALAKSFRPISLSSFLLKGLERLVDRYLRDEVLTKYPLHPNQHAYQVGKSTESALHILVGKIEQALELRLYALGAFFDIEGAFDNVPFQAMADALEDRQVPKVICLWVSNMLRQRVVTASLGDSNKSVSVLRGCPQGGVLSPLIWCLMVDDLLKKMNANNLFTLGYSDDGVILLGGRDLNQVCVRMQGALDAVMDWCKPRDLSVHPDKLELVLFTRRIKLYGLHLPVLGGKQLELSSQVKYLGVILDKRMKWEHHIASKCSKAIRAFWQLKRAVGNKWGLSPKITYWMYTSVIKPMVNYACLVWWPRLNLVSARKQLLQLQRLACLSITGALRSTPTAAMEILLGLLPVQVEVVRSALLACHRLVCTNNWDTSLRCAHARIYYRLGSVAHLSMDKSDAILRRFEFQEKVSLSIPSREEWTRDTLPTRTRGIACYTDGSFIEGTAGAGVFIPRWRVQLSFPLGAYCTVAQAEVYAILQCVKYIADQFTRGCSFSVFSDSQAALKALTRPIITSELVRLCRQEMARVCRFNRLTLSWVPGHRGIEGNEKADQLAREGASQAPTSRPVGIAPALVKAQVETWALSEAQASWTSRTDCRQSREFIPGYRQQFTRQLLQRARRDVRVIVGLLTGHCLNKHLFRMGLANESLCHQCKEEEESSIHFLCSCPAFMALRQDLWGVPTITPLRIRAASIGDLLRLSHASGRFSCP